MKLRHVQAALFSMVVCSFIPNVAPIVNAEYLRLTADKVTVSLYPRIVQVGAAMRMTCRVPRQPDNRRLLYGVVNFRDSERQLEGENSQVTWEVFVDHVPCEIGKAYCTVVRSDGTYETSTLQPVVAGCEEN